jgi:hypothetical protein
MDVFSAWWWVRQSGKEEWKSANLMQGFDFDPVKSRFIDSWWPVNDKTKVITQYIRCYSPADLLLLLEGTGLELVSVEVKGKEIDLSRTDHNMSAPLWEEWKYLVKIVPANSCDNL